jgi:hypothetical protein
VQPSPARGRVRAGPRRTIGRGRGRVASFASARRGRTISAKIRLIFDDDVAHRPAGPVSLLVETGPEGSAPRRDPGRTALSCRPRTGGTPWATVLGLVPCSSAPGTSGADD